MDVSVIIVNYNTKQLTINCLSSVFEQTKGIDFEVIVSDNGSTDGSTEAIKEKFPQVVLLENGANLGFGTANNRGLDVAKGKYIFYLNSDTLLLNNAIKMFYDFWENHPEKDSIGALGGVLLDERLETIHSGGQFPTYSRICKDNLIFLFLHIYKTLIKILRLSSYYQKKKKNISFHEFVEIGETKGYITGADLFVKNNEFARFDENFFMYYEETDMEWRMENAGLKRFIIEGPRIQHLVRKSNKKFTVLKSSDFFSQDSSIYYLRKNHKSNAYFLKFIVWVDRLNPYVRTFMKKLNYP